MESRLDVLQASQRVQNRLTIAWQLLKMREIPFSGCDQQLKPSSTSIPSGPFRYELRNQSLNLLMYGSPIFLVTGNSVLSTQR